AGGCGCSRPLLRPGRRLRRRARHYRSCRSRDHHPDSGVRLTSAASDAAAAVRRLLGEEADNVRPLGGTASMVTLRSGQRLTVKHGSGDNAVWAEAAGLRWLGESGDVPVPWVHAADTEWLITDHIPAGRSEEHTSELQSRFDH